MYITCLNLFARGYVASPSTQNQIVKLLYLITSATTPSDVLGSQRVFTFSLQGISIDSLLIEKLSCLNRI